ncbi:hypothetical protein AAG906_017304 [Vitis piasezkii]
MTRIRGGHTDPSVSRETKPRASSPQDSSQAPEAPIIPSSKGGAPVVTDSQHPFDISPEAIIKRLIVTAPPIEGNSDCRVIPFHFELYFDIEAMRE